MRSKVTVVGAGNVGASCAQRIAERGYADVVLVDIVEGIPQGKALDLLQAAPVLGVDYSITGTNRYDETADSAVAVITAGIARKPGMSRDDLLLTNMNIVKGVIQSLVKFSPHCFIIVVTNPIDAMSHLAFKLSGFPRSRVLGMSGILDSARFRTFVAQELGVSVEDVSACVLGGHGDAMVPLPRLATVGGIPLTELLPPATIDRIVARTIQGGAEIVALLKTGSAYYAPAAAAVQMVDSILLDWKRILPCSVHLEGEYGIEGVFVGVPVKVGKEGVAQILEIKLNSEEREALKKSADSVRELVAVMQSAGAFR